MVRACKSVKEKNRGGYHGQIPLCRDDKNALIKLLLKKLKNRDLKIDISN